MAMGFLLWGIYTGARAFMPRAWFGSFECDDSPSPEQCKALMLDLIEEEKKKLTNLKEILEENERLELEAKLVSTRITARRSRIPWP
jgi:hypothetical protein